MIKALLLMALASIATAAYFVLSRRQRIPDLELSDEVLPPIDEALPLVAGLTGAALHHGNAVKVFQNGALIDRIMEEIQSARHSVHFETFVWNTGELERNFCDLLCKKAREGITVRILVDYVGAKRAGESRLSTLRESGVILAQYRPIGWLSVRRFNNRMHRKMLVLDGETAFIFGHGISDEWMGNAEDKDHWRDTGMRLSGPVVAPLQATFAQDWITASRTIPLEAGYFTPSADQGPVTAHIASSEAGEVHSSVALLYILAIACAREEIIIQNPYFTPDPSIPKLLRTMASRGVKIHLMVPGKYTDSPFVRQAGQRLYRSLLESGVKIYEFKPTLLHQKIVIVDGSWSHIGSTNFDARSLALNAEIGVGLQDREVARELRSAFFDDLRRSREINLERWRKRRWYWRLLDWSAYQLHGQI